jgi:hypothetical protein
MIGKPYSGKLNVRFDEGELEIGYPLLRQLPTLPHSTAWHSEFKEDISGEKFPLDGLGPKEYLLAGCYPSDSLVNPSTSASTFRSVL